MGKNPVNLGYLPNSLSFPDIFRVSAFVFPQKRFFFADSLNWEPVLHSFLSYFVLPTEERNVSFSADVLLYAHLPQNLWGTKFISSRHKEKRQPETNLTTVFSDSKFEMILQQELLYSQHLRGNLVWKIAADDLIKDMVQDIANELAFWHAKRHNVFAANC